MELLEADLGPALLLSPVEIGLEPDPIEEFLEGVYADEDRRGCAVT